jgi:hypothetical protein
MGMVPSAFNNVKVLQQVVMKRFGGCGAGVLQFRFQTLGLAATHLPSFAWYSLILTVRAGKICETSSRAASFSPRLIKTMFEAQETHTA